MSKLWGGRFSKETNPLVEKFAQSIHFDYKLAYYDLLGTIFHILILRENNYLTKDEYKKLIDATTPIRKKILKEGLIPDSKYEDIHTQIQNEIEKEVGSDLVLKLHTARSRNDQVVFATKAYCKAQIGIMEDNITKFTNSVRELIKENDGLIIPGFTHLQHAQPVYLSEYLGAYISMFKRDSNRLKSISQNLVITLGAGALAGTPIEATFYNQKTLDLLDQNFFKDLRNLFKLEATENSLDVVSDRDFVVEIISALSILAMHLSRLSEDLIIWATKEFDFIEIDDAFCTGSSLMPQKKNPDVLELIRGNTGRLYGNLVSVLTMMKGLPLTYNRDMQLDKEPLFNSFEVISEELQVLEGLIKTLKFNRPKIEEHLKDESLYATDLVYYLVEKGIPFKTAHTMIGELVNYSLLNKIRIQDMPEDVLKEKFCEKIVKKEFNRLFDPKVSVESKKSINRTAK